MILGALAGGLVGTVVLTTGLRLAQEVGWTRMDIPLLLGTMLTGDRGRAEALGYAFHFLNGFGFSLVYGLVFTAVGQAGWLFGLALGIVHAAFAGGALVNLILPAIHPRMGSPWTDASESPVLEPPGFMLVNYGSATVLVTLVLHMAYGAIVARVRSRLVRPTRASNFGRRQSWYELGVQNKTDRRRKSSVARARRSRARSGGDAGGRRH